MAMAIPVTIPAPPASITRIDRRMKRTLHIAGGVSAIAFALALAASGAIFLPPAVSRPALDNLAKGAAFAETLPSQTITAAAAIDPTLGPFPDGDALAAAALADLLSAERAGAGRNRQHLDAAHAHLRAQAQATPANPYLWARLASLELAMGAGADRVGQLLAHSIKLGRNATAAWPARIAVGFRIWPEAPETLRQEVLAEAQRMWFKSPDRHWDKRAMQDRLADLAVANGMTDRLAPIIATTPEEFARWNYIVSQQAARL